MVELLTYETMKTSPDSWTPSIGAARVLARCDALALRSDEAGRVTRTFLSPAMKEAHKLVGGWMRKAGMTTRVDALGNLIGHWAGTSSDAPFWILGSHLDTVPNAGKYDGTLGVLLAIEVVASFREPLPFAIEVIGFSEEEGVRFKTPYLGSRAVAGCFDSSLLNLRDAEGFTMRAAIANFGLSPDEWRAAQYGGKRVSGYFEAHIEQGPILESLGEPLGFVTSIAGQSRARLRFIGHAGHAGTLPMHLRRDALVAAGAWILEVEKIGASTAGLMATVGFIQASPNAANVVPGEVLCSLDVRHADDDQREKATDKLVEIARLVAAQRGIEIEVVSRLSQPAVPMDSRLQQLLRESTDGAPDIVSGAGHDAAIMAQLAPATMLFLRTPGGQSHCPDEAVNESDVALALEAMRTFLIKIANSGD